MFLKIYNNEVLWATQYPQQEKRMLKALEFAHPNAFFMRMYVLGKILRSSGDPRFTPFYLRKNMWLFKEGKNYGSEDLSVQNCAADIFRRHHVKVLHTGTILRGLDEMGYDFQLGGVVKLYNKRRHTFPVGALDLALSSLNSKLVRVQDCRDKLDIPMVSNFVFPGGLENRPYQTRILNVALKTGCGIIAAATNSGKTEIARFIYSCLKGGPAIFLVNTRSLFTQTYERFQEGLEKSGYSVGCFGDAKHRLLSLSGLNVVTAQSAWSQIYQHTMLQRLFSTAKILFIDECDQYGAEAWYHLAWLCRARRRYGFSGSVREDKRDPSFLKLKAIVGPIIGEVSNRELVESGVSAKLTVRILNIYARILPNDWTYAKQYREGIVLNEVRNEAIVKEAKYYRQRGLQVVISVVQVKHGRLLRDLFAKHKMDATFLSGSTDDEVRERAKSLLRHKLAGIVIVSDIWKRGMDIPEIQALILAGGLRKWKYTIQWLGRVLRRKTGVNRGYVTDFMDWHSPKYLLRHSRERLQTMRREDCFEFEKV